MEPENKTKQTTKIKRNHYEHIAWKSKRYLCGIDEAGRGCLFGPVVVAAAIIPQRARYALLKDSKVMSKAQRETAYAWIIKNCFFSYACIDIRTIEKKNIYHATRYGMKKVFIQLLETIPFPLQKIQFLISDAMPLSFDKPYRHDNLTLLHPPHAESLSSSVAAASIVAKVTRDRLVENLAKYFPQFSLERHKGYGTHIHYDAIEKHGLSILHRPSFIIGEAHAGKRARPCLRQQTIC